MSERVDNVNVAPSIFRTCFYTHSGYLGVCWSLSQLPWSTVRVTPLDTTPLHRRAAQLFTFTHNLEFSMHLTCMLLNCRNKLKNPERTLRGFSQDLLAERWQSKPPHRRFERCSKEPQVWGTEFWVKAEERVLWKILKKIELKKRCFSLGAHWICKIKEKRIKTAFPVPAFTLNKASSWTAGYWCSSSSCPHRSTVWGTKNSRLDS